MFRTAPRHRRRPRPQRTVCTGRIGHQPGGSGNALWPCCRRLLACCLLLCCLQPGPAAAAAQSAQSVWLRPVSVTIPFSKGNEIDALFTLLQGPFKALTGQEMRLAYMPGRGGTDAWATADQEKKQGEVFTAIELPGLILRALQPDSGLTLDDLSVCHVTAYSPLALWVPKNSPYKNLNELVLAARKKPYKIYVSGPGSYSGAELATLRLNRMVGVIIMYLPHMGTLEGAKAAQKGEAQAFWGDAVLLPGLRDDYRALAVAAEERSPALPAVPTFKELQVDLLEGSYRGVALPASSSERTRMQVHELMNRLLASPGLAPLLAATGFAVVDVPFAEIPTFMQTRIDRYSELAREHDIRLR